MALESSLLHMAPQLQLRDIRLTLGGAPMLDGAELTISPGDRIALVGRNGSGKSTLLRIAAGETAADGGTRFAQPNARLRYLPQEPDLTGYATTLDFVLAGLDDDDGAYRARAYMEDLGVHPEADPVKLSGGEARRAALARVLAAEPDILLLDEPTNHLDLVAIEWLESELQDSRAAFVLISHDKRLLADLTQATVWLDRGATRRLEQGFAAFEAWRDQKLEEEEAERHKLDRRIVAEEHWMRYGVTARRKRNMRRVGELSAMRRERREAQRAVGVATMVAQDVRASGALVIEAEAISKAYEGRPIVKDFSLRVMRGDRLGIIGANGAGKTTLINLLTGQLPPDAGIVRLGSQVAMATLDQRRATLSPTTTLVDALTGGGSDYVTVGAERGRLMLARALALPSNVLVLDEPTNDLDIETLDLLQELLADYAGTLLLVSHDRDFLDRVVTSVLVSEGGGRWVEYAGGYSDMVAQRGYGLSGPSRQAARKAEKAAPNKPDRAVPKRKLSFNESRALSILPEKIEHLRRELATLERALADASLHERDPHGFRRTTGAYAAKRSELEKAEHDWLELEILREEVEGSR